jgi:proline-specific peptidase
VLPVCDPRTTSNTLGPMRVSIGDVKLFVDVDGAGLVVDGPAMREQPTLVMLHGGPGIDHTLFKQPLFAPLTRVAQVVYYDHRGNGRSDRGHPSDWNLDRWADDVVALCDALGIERPIVFGSSFGGFVALNYALRHPQHPGKLILSSTAAHIDFERSASMVEQLGGLEARHVFEAFWAGPTEETYAEYRRVCLPLYTQRPQPPELSARMTRNLDVMAHFPRSGEMQFDYRDRLDAVRCPVLVMAGGLDPIVTIADARELAAALPPSTTCLVEFPTAGHMLAFEDPEAVVPLMIDFIAS